MKLNLFEKISELPVVFGKALNTTNDDYHFFQNGFEKNSHNGMEYLTIAFFVVSLLFCLYFYFIQAKKLSNATRKNYIIIFLLGLFTLIVVDFVLMATFVGHTSVFSDANMYKALIISSVWYCVLYQIYSWFFKSMSNVPYLDLISCFKRK